MSAVTFPRGTVSVTSRRISRSPYENVTLRNSASTEGSGMQEEVDVRPHSAVCMGKTRKGQVRW